VWRDVVVVVVVGVLGVSKSPSGRSQRDGSAPLHSRILGSLERGGERALTFDDDDDDAYVDAPPQLGERR
jgi:hypothetical protein